MMLPHRLSMRSKILAMTNKKEQVLEQLLGQKLLPLFYHESESTSIKILQALYDAGIRTVEYTNRGENALLNFSEMKKMTDTNWPGLHLGIGTIKNKEQAKQFIDAGADYVICPSMNEEVASVTHDANLLWIPGCMTATEIAAAENADASLVKIFPGSLLGPGYINAIKDLFPRLKFMPTGGVEAEKENLQAWFASGVVAVGMGSKLISKKMLADNNFQGITELTKDALQLVRDCSK